MCAYVGVLCDVQGRITLVGDMRALSSIAASTSSSAAVRFSWFKNVIVNNYSMSNHHLTPPVNPVNHPTRCHNTTTPKRQPNLPCLWAYPYSGTATSTTSTTTRKTCCTFHDQVEHAALEANHHIERSHFFTSKGLPSFRGTLCPGVSFEQTENAVPTKQCLVLLCEIVAHVDVRSAEREGLRGPRVLSR